MELKERTNYPYQQYPVRYPYEIFRARARQDDRPPVNPEKYDSLGSPGGDAAQNSTLIFSKNLDNQLENRILNELWCSMIDLITHFFRPKTLRWLKIRKENAFVVLIRDRDSEPTRSWAISKSHAYAFTCQIPPSMTFWSISRIPAYLKTKLRPERIKGVFHDPLTLSYEISHFLFCWMSRTE